VLPFAVGFGFGRKRSLYTTLLMATGLTFGTISALFGLTNGFIDQSEYSVLVTVIILSAIVPTLIAERFFRPEEEPMVTAAAETRVSAPEGVKSEV
jgi:Kef-type K+ transport system membrane component KefB